jgi:hypothetical protein
VEPIHKLLIGEKLKARAIEGDGMGGHALLLLGYKVI